jgi:hypothetical protein
LQSDMRSAQRSRAKNAHSRPERAADSNQL